MNVRETAHRAPQGLIGRAYAFAKKTHRGQQRKSGEPYFDHCAKVAEILAQWNMDETTIVAGLLHDVAEDTEVTPKDITKEFGEEISFLVDGVTKLGRIKYRGNQSKVENLRKFILALSQDLRVVFVKLADRLHNMRTLSALPPHKQKRIAMETDEIYAALAYRLGMHEISGELHDLAFPFLHPKEYQLLKAQVTDEYHARRKYLEAMEPRVRDALKNADLTPLAIDFRAKHYYSLYQKLQRYDMDIEKIYDLVALRVILPKIEDCYAALGIIHQAWPPLPGRIKDYIAMPKANNYRSLHTTIIGPQEKYIEIQLRTKEMHEESEYGIAAHLLYKVREAHAHGGGSERQRFDETTRWLRELHAWQKKYTTDEDDSREFLASMKIEFFKDRVFAITPKGDVLDLPQGATPIDFAYHIHSEIGDTCVGAKVNGQFVTLHHVLHSGDMVEIVTQKNKRPSEDWLKFVHTLTARDHIRASLREKRRHVVSRRAPTKTQLRIVIHDRIGLIKDISSIIARSHLNITGFHVDHPAGSNYPIDNITIATVDKKKIEKLILNLKKIKEVKEINYRLL